MAHKRMFSKDIVQSDAFLDMPASTQALYFHLGMEADDDGFIGNPRRLQKVIGSSDDDIKILIGKRFVIIFPSGVLVVKHHRINNNWDRYNAKRTVYIEELSQLNIKENRAYTLDKDRGVPVQSDSSLEPVSRREEKRVEEKRIEKAPTLEASMEYLKSIPDEDMKYFTERFDVSPAGVRSIAEDLRLYCARKGKTYRNYKAFLLNALKRDCRLRLVHPAIIQDSTPLTLEERHRAEEAREHISKLVGKKSL